MSSVTETLGPVVTSAGATIGVVGSCYLWPATWNQSTYERDNSQNIALRMLSLLGCSGLALWLMAQNRATQVGMISALRSALGSDDHSVAAATKEAISVTLKLFSGVLIERGFNFARHVCDETVHATVAEWNARPNAVPRIFPDRDYWLRGALFGLKKHGLRLFWNANYKGTFHRKRIEWCVISMRNLVVAPFFEEIVYRAGLTSLLESAAKKVDSSSSWQLRMIETPAQRMVLTSSLFAISHLHHVFRLKHERFSRLTHTSVLQLRPQSEEKLHRKAWIEAIREILPQILITFVFGLFSTYLFNKLNRHVVACSIAHALCNWLGAPSLRYLKGDRNQEVAGRALPLPRTVQSVEKVLISIGHLYGIASFVQWSHN